MVRTRKEGSEPAPSPLLRIAENAREPVDGIIVKDFAEHWLRQRQARVSVPVELHRLSGSEELPVERIAAVPFFKRFTRIVLRKNSVVRSIKHAVLILDQERPNL